MCITHYRRAKSPSTAVNATEEPRQPLPRGRELIFALSTPLCDALRQSAGASPRLPTAVEDAVTVEPVCVKGIRSPFAAYNVLGTEPAN